MSVLTAKQSSGTLMIAKTVGWVAIVLSVSILLVFATIRLVEMTRDLPPTDAFRIRYIRHPRVALLHMIPGLLFLTLGPLQFIPRVRQRHLGFHRGLGRVLTLCAAVSGLFALIVSFRLPAFGGLSTQAATVFFGVIFLFSLAKAIRHIRRKEVLLHREWMIRTFALAMGAATIRLIVGLFLALSNRASEEVFGTSFWLGFSLNLLVAEVWIRQTRGRSERPPNKPLQPTSGVDVPR